MFLHQLKSLQQKTERAAYRVKWAKKCQASPPEYDIGSGLSINDPEDGITKSISNTHILHELDLVQVPIFCNFFHEIIRIQSIEHKNRNLPQPANFMHVAVAGGG